VASGGIPPYERIFGAVTVTVLSFVSYLILFVKKNIVLKSSVT
jgi:hypothetical protein